MTARLIADAQQRSYCKITESVASIETAISAQFDRRSISGWTGPRFVTCQDAAGAEIEVAAKLPDWRKLIHPPPPLKAAQ